MPTYRPRAKSPKVPLVEVQRQRLRIYASALTELREHIVAHLGCVNCGAKRGQPCKHDYGCIDTDRRKS